jgi:hypothetical protein
VCPFCREDIRRDAAVCHHCGANVLVLIDASVFTGNGCRPDPTLRAAGSGPGGSGGGDEAPEPWWRVCFMIPVPDCHIEPGKPVDSKDGAGFEDDEIVCDGWKMVKVCIPW